MKNKNKVPTLSIVILNYNAADFLKNCLLSIEKSYQQDLKKEGQEYKIDQVIVVDNNSTDGSKEFLRDLEIWRYRDIDKKNKKKENYSSSKSLNLYRANNSERSISLRVIFNNQNLGFAAGNNVGIKEALKRQTDYLLFLNPDTIVYPGVLGRVISHLQNDPKIGGASCYLELPSGEIDEACHRGFPTPWRALSYFSGLAKLFPRSKILSGYTLGHLRKLTTPHEIDSCSGAFFLVRKEAGEQVGWWDEDYFWYGEDIDFCFRLKRAGWKILFVPEVKILHYKGVTSGIKKHTQKISKASLETRIKAAKASTQAMRIFYQKHYFSRYPKLIRSLVFTGINLLERYRIWVTKRRYSKLSSQ